MNQEEAKQFVDSNKFPVQFTNLQSRCVDGRSPQKEDEARIPAISKPGADIGDLIITLGALNKLEIKADPKMVLDTITETYGGPFNLKFHTDAHALEKGAGPGLGCGHINFATQHPEDYHLSEDQTEFILEQLPKLLDEGAKQIVLNGDHAEKAVLVIESDFYGVKPNNGDTQVFVYQKRLHEQQLGKLTKPLAYKLKASGQVVEEGSLRKAIDEVFHDQLGATLGRIAKGLPIFSVNIPQSGAVHVEAVA
ncbi:hypothetical protein IPM19_03995 [bacterium]|nr:MAG: hypothetical protein IPM19_03995 [bacterium]